MNASWRVSAPLRGASQDKHCTSSRHEFEWEDLLLGPVAWVAAALGAVFLFFG